MRYLLLSIFILALICPFGVYDKEAHGSDIELTTNIGYHTWTQSGHTFAHSDVSDKEFNTWAAQVEITNWWNWVGLYGYIGMDDKVEQEIFPGKDYEADIWYSGIGLKARKELFDSLKGYIGYGINYTYLKNTYAGKHIETWDDEIGHDFLLGVNYYINPSWFVTINGRYTLNKMWSDVWYRTSFNPDGLRMWMGLGVRF